MREPRLRRLEQWEGQILRARPLVRALTLLVWDLTRLAAAVGALLLAVDRALALL